MAKIVDIILKREYELKKDSPYIIGRNKELSDIVIPPIAGTVSRVHGLIKFNEFAKTWQYLDLKSDNGTKINRDKWEYKDGPCDLMNNSIIELASDVIDEHNKPYQLIFRNEE